jgi:ASC-1-like (ASCH) protein
MIVTLSSIIVVAACNPNLFSNVFEWTKDTFLSFIGIKIQEENIERAVSDLKRYETVEEFEKNENISILIPGWLPGDLKIDYVAYSEDHQSKFVSIWFNDKFSLLTINFAIESINPDIASKDKKPLQQRGSMIK